MTTFTPGRASVRPPTWCTDTKLMPTVGHHRDQRKADNTARLMHVLLWAVVTWVLPKPRRDSKAGGS